MQPTQKEPPYPVQAIGDLVNHYSVEHFRFAIGQVRDVIAKVVAEDDRSDQQIARVRILIYLDRQLVRAVSWAKEDADLMALVVRSQIELRFWADYVSKGPNEAAQFLNEADIDARQLHEKLMKAYPAEVRPLPVSIPGKLISLTRINDDEDAIHKLCSKLIHPTSLALNSPENSILNTGYRDYLAVQVVKYGWGILEIFHPIQWTP